MTKHDAATHEKSTIDTARALSALGHAARLDVFRLLVRAGDTGLIVGDIATHTGLPASTLAHHLRALVTAGLVSQQLHGRETLNIVNFTTMDATIAFLTDECCQGVASQHMGTA